MERTPVRFKYAVISFCADLTKPKRETVPVAVVGSGEVPAHGFAFLMATAESPVEDPVAREVLARMPRVLWEEIAADLGKYGPEGSLRRLSQQMTQSLQVSRIDEAEVKVPGFDLQSLTHATIERFVDLIWSPGRPRRSMQTGRATGGGDDPPLPAFRLEPLSGSLVGS